MGVATEHERPGNRREAVGHRFKSIVGRAEGSGAVVEGSAGPLREDFNEMPVLGDDVACVRCGLTPTRSLPIRRHVGLLLAQQFVKVQQPLCRDHGTELTKQFLRRTMAQGWWGFISIFVNVWVVAKDVAVLRAYGALAPPSGLPWANRPGGVLAPVDSGERAAAWHPDPVGRHELRWHDGAAWTARVSDAGVAGIDPLLPA